MNTSGKITSGFLPGLLRDLYLKRRTGLLAVSRGEHHGSVCFVNGQIAWGESSIPHCQLGPVLIRNEFASRKAVESVAKLVTPRKRLGTLLVEEGHLDATRLDEALTLHVRETLNNIFQWQDGFWKFDECPPEDLLGYDGALRISTGDLILDAVWSVSDPDVVRYQLGDLDRPLAVTTNPELRFQKIRFDDTDGYFMSRIDGVRTARELLEQSPVGEDEARHSLFGLLCTGLLEWVEPRKPEPARVAPPEAKTAAAPPPPSEATPQSGPPVTPDEVKALYRDLSTRDHFSLLGVSSQTTPAEVRDKFLQHVRRFNPEAQSDPRLEGLRKELETICARLAEAERVLSDPWRKSGYEATLQRLKTLAPGSAAAPESAPAAVAPHAPPEDPEAVQARLAQALSEAEQVLDEGRFWDALQKVEGVLAEVGTERTRLRSRALFMRARVYMKNPKWRKESEQLLKDLVAEEPGNADAFFQLGLLYKHEGIATRAAAMFRKVLELKPRHEGARAELPSEPKAAKAGAGWLPWKR